MAACSLVASKTPGIILAEAMMMQAAFDGIFFLVEGDDDAKFWKTRVVPSNVSIISCEGKTNLLGATPLLVGKAIPLIGVYDPDHERLVGVFHHPNVLVPTDFNDLEVTLLNSESLDALLHEFADGDLLTAFERTAACTVRDYIEVVSKEFGRLRYLSAIAGHKVDFDNMSPYRYLSPNDWSFDKDGLLNEYASLAAISRNDLDAALAANCSVQTPWAYSQGHDSIRILAQGLKRRIGLRQLGEPDVMRILRIAHSREIFARTQMFAALRRMEAALAVVVLS